MDIDAVLAEKLATILPRLNEKQRRLVLAAEARALGHGGIARVARAASVSRPTIQKGLRELVEPDAAPERVRQVGGGRKQLRDQDPTLVHDLEALVEPVTRGDPMSPLRWTCKSTRQLAAELVRQGHQLSHQAVADLLHALDYSLQGTRKTKEGSDHPDRDAQFAYINEQTRAFQQRGQPAISVDCKKKELVGDFKNGGREWQPAGQPEAVRVHDFLDKQLGKDIPYGGFDVAANPGWVGVGAGHETGAFGLGNGRHWV